MADARNTALVVLNKLEQGKQTLDAILEDMTCSEDNLSKRERALFNALTYGVLRRRGGLDYIIAHFSNTPKKKLSPAS